MVYDFSEINSKITRIKKKSRSFNIGKMCSVFVRKYTGLSFFHEVRNVCLNSTYYLIIINDLLNEADNRKVFILSLLDLSAFDTIDHDVL